MGFGNWGHDKTKKRKKWLSMSRMYNEHKLSDRTFTRDIRKKQKNESKGGRSVTVPLSFLETPLVGPGVTETLVTGGENASLLGAREDVSVVVVRALATYKRRR